MPSRERRPASVGIAHVHPTARVIWGITSRIPRPTGTEPEPCRRCVRFENAKQIATPDVAQLKVLVSPRTDSAGSLRWWLMVCRLAAQFLGRGAAADNPPLPRHAKRDESNPRTTEAPTIPTDSHNSGLTTMSRAMPRKTAIRMPSEIFNIGSCNRWNKSELNACASAPTRRIARMRLASALQVVP